MKAFVNFLFKRDIKFEIKEGKIIMEVEAPVKKFVEMFKGKFKEMFNLELEVNEIKNGKNEDNRDFQKTK